MAEQQGQWNNIPNALESAQMRDAMSGLGTRTCVCIVVPGRWEMMELISGGRVRLSTRIWNCGSRGMLNRYDLFGRVIADLAYWLARLLSSLELGVIEHGTC